MRYLFFSGKVFDLETLFFKVPSNYLGPIRFYAHCPFPLYSFLSAEDGVEFLRELVSEFGVDIPKDFAQTGISLDPPEVKSDVPPSQPPS